MLQKKDKFAQKLEQWKILFFLLFSRYRDKINHNIIQKFTIEQCKKKSDVKKIDSRFPGKLNDEFDL